MQDIKEVKEVKAYPAGTFSWVDLATTDAAAAKQFYASLFGWEAHDEPAGPDMVYTMLALHGKWVAGLYELNEQQRSQSVPPHWLSYVSVENIEASARKAAELGGTLLLEPCDVAEAGRMALVQDPTGAIFGLWQAKNHIGAQVVNMPGAVGWNELATTDTTQAAAFYNGLFGWTAEASEMPGGVVYTAFKNQERYAGGMLQMTEEWGDIPPAWSVYFLVEDCDAAAQKAQELGATVLVPGTDIPDMGRFAVLQDPTGAVFTVMYSKQIDPPPGY